MKYILALDQGTTGSTALVFDENAFVISKAYKEFTQHYPHPGWVEHDAEEIWDVSVQVMKQACSAIDVKNIAAIGITNQRETVVVWDKKTGKPVHKAIVWQCRRTADVCKKLKDQGKENFFKEKTGLPLDPYFSATKIACILEKQDNHSDLLCGTIDSWLLYKLTNGKIHATEPSNASRTHLFNIHTEQWDDELLSLLNIPKHILPEIKDSVSHFGNTNILGHSIPIMGIAGDQQAALFGQHCFNKGDIKNTYGTGCFMLQNTGEIPMITDNGLLTTVAWKINKKTTYALEGSVFVAGAVVQWLRDGLGIISDASQTESLAQSVKDTNGVYFVPAFTGLGTPHWDPHARGALFGLTRGTKKEHIVRAALESIALQSLDLMKAMGQESKKVKVDGGASNNNFLMQFQADIANLDIHRSRMVETTARGAAYLAGIGVGLFDIDTLGKKDDGYDVFNPHMQQQTRDSIIASWNKAIGKSKNWET